MIEKNYNRLIAEAYQRFKHRKKSNYDYLHFDKTTMTRIYFNENVNFRGEKEFMFSVIKNRKKIFSEEAIPESKMIRIAKLVEIFGK